MTHSLFTRYGSQVADDKVITPADAKGAGTYRATKACHRCGGVGGSDAWKHTGWTCYECGGKGTWPVVEKCYTAEKLAKLNATKAKADAKREAAATAKRDAANAAAAAANAEWRKINGPAADNIVAQSTLHRIVSDVAGKIAIWGTVSDKTLDFALGIIVSKLAEADQHAASRHVGEIGERIDLELTVEHIIRFDPYCYGAPPSALFICRDVAGNRVIYKGSAWLADKGETVAVRATVKDHDERNGELQTIISRPAPPKA